MEHILNAQDIKDVEDEAATEFAFKYYGVRLMDNPSYNFKKVLQVSDINNLILIKGNKDTGYEHIRMRHNYWTTSVYPQGESFQFQGLFPQDTYPAIFVKIADTIYSQGNHVKDNDNQGAKIFDLYTGEYVFKGLDTPDKVKLLVYKDTRIIHTLYPQSSKYNKKKKNRPNGFKFARGEVKVVQHDAVTKLVFVPYLDLNLRTKYVLIVEKNVALDKERLSIYIYDDSENLIDVKVLGYRKLIAFSGDTSERITYQHGDLRPIEKIISEIDSESSVP